jgi:hypothetical protein
MAKKIDRRGHRYGRLTVLREWGKNRHGQFRWLCECDCGQQSVVDGPSLATKNTTSCGCYFLEQTTKHGHARRIKGASGKRTLTKTYFCWRNMRTRCNDTSSKDYPSYGGRGIHVCGRWNDSFEAFLSDMGEQPEGLTLERVDNERGYEPGNCIWTTRAAQRRNTRAVHHITYRGQQMCLTDAARASGLNPSTLTSRIRRGWDESRLFLPTNQTDTTNATV